MARVAHSFPVHAILPALKRMRFSSRGWRSLQHISVDAQIIQVSAQGILLSEFPQPSNGFRQRLIWVDAVSGRVSHLVAFPLGEEARAAVVSGHFLVYAEGAFKNGTYHFVSVENLASHRTYRVTAVPAASYSVGPLQGLAIQRQTVYWLSTLLTPEGLVSRIYQENLTSRTSKIIVSDSQSVSGSLVVGMSVAPRGLWMSVAAKTGGSLWYWSYRAHRIVRRIAVPQVPHWLYGANASAVVLSTDYSARPIETGVPYPVYAVEPQQRVAVQLTTAADPGGESSVSGNWVAIDGLGIHSELLNLKTKRFATFGVPEAVVGGGWIVLRSQDGIRWHRL